MCMCVCVYVCMCVCVYVCMCDVCMSIYVYVCMCVEHGFQPIVIDVEEESKQAEDQERAQLEAHSSSSDLSSDSINPSGESSDIVKCSSASCLVAKSAAV